MSKGKDKNNEKTEKSIGNTAFSNDGAGDGFNGISGAGR